MLPRTILKSAEAKGLIFAESSRGKNLRKIVDELRTKLPELTTTICTSDMAELMASGDPALELPGLKPDHTMQIQYTSGTTGFPKGVLLNHRGLFNNARLVMRRLSAAADDVKHGTPRGSNARVRRAC